MKDNDLEKQFDEYFKGVNISNDIVADAKKPVEHKRKAMPRIVRFASIAASIVLVFAVALTVILKTDFNKVAPGNSVGDSGASGDSTGSPDVSEGDASLVSYYTDSDLEKSDANANSISKLNSSLKIIENFAMASNANVESCKAAYKDDKLALVIAKVNILNGLNRDETTVFVEFTEKNTVYGELADYYEPSVRYFDGNEYYLTQTVGENGEPEFRLHISYGGVKYYFNVHSSDKYAYEKYLYMVTK